MAASLSIHCVGSSSSLRCRGLNYGDPSNQNARPCSLPIINSRRRRQRRRISTMAAAVANSGLHLKPREKLEGTNNEGSGNDKIDEWMRESVTAIVKNLRETPLLVQVFSEKNGTTKVKTANAAVEDWEIIKGKWKVGNTPLPEAVILVEELKEKKENYDSETESEERRGNTTTRAWGLVIQEKGVERGAPACYLLKTTRVRSGLGLCCTHFCLAKVNSFRETAESQLTNCWLFN